MNSKAFPGSDIRKWKLKSPNTKWWRVDFMIQQNTQTFKDQYLTGRCHGNSTDQCFHLLVWEFRRMEFYEGDITALMQPGFSNVSYQICLFNPIQVIYEQDLIIDEPGIFCIKLRQSEILLGNEATGQKQKLVPNYPFPFQWNGLLHPPSCPLVFTTW